MDKAMDEQQPQTLGEKTRRVASQAQQKASEQVRTGIDSGKRQAAGALHGVAESLLHGTGDQADGAARYIQQAGEQVRRAADWLEQADIDEVTQKTEEFARRQPALFIGGAFALGLVAARFLKSSSRNQEGKRSSERFTPAPLADMPGSEYDTMNAGISDSELGTSGYGEPNLRTSGQVYRDGGL